jgi:outer membrane receptor protein involved in Fe transport
MKPLTPLNCPPSASLIPVALTGRVTRNPDTPHEIFCTLPALPFCCRACASPPSAFADTLELDPSVITGSRSASPSFDLPYSVDSINQQQISDGQLGINASEVLSRVPGLVVQNRQNYAQDLQISSRGFGARSAFGVRGIKLIADGIPASTPDGQGQAATFNLDTAERIEVCAARQPRFTAAMLAGSFRCSPETAKGRLVLAPKPSSAATA